MEFRVLGPLEVLGGTEPIALGRRRGERCLLGLLLLDAGAVVPLDRLLDLLWDGDPPEAARGTVKTHVARLRSVLDPHRDGRLGVRLQRRGEGYLVDVDPDAVDAHRFRQLSARAMRASGAEDRSTMLREALRLWRGPLLADVASDRLRDRVGTGLAELRLSMLEEWAEAELDRGRHRQLIAELVDLVQAHPLRERLVGALMLALGRDDRQADALALYRRTRDALGEQLGLDPGPELRGLHDQILRGDPAPAPAPTGSTLTGPVPTAPDAEHVRPAQLPAHTRHFTGRGGQLRELDAVLAEVTGGTGPAVVVISAAAGTGKSALAVHWAQRVRHRFPDGQLYLDLRAHAAAPALRPIEALAALLAALGLPAERVPTEPDQATGVYRSLVADRRLLIVLDDALDPEQVRPLLPGGPTAMVVVTSRLRLGGLVAIEGAQRLALDVLDRDEAVALIGAVVGADRIRAEPDAVHRLVEVCDRLPLALRIAAANLADEPDTGVAAFVDRLAGARLASLRVDGDDRAAVRVAFELSYRRLDAAVRRMFRLVALAPGPDVTAGTAAALAAVPPGRAAALLAVLTDAHLVHQVAADRFRMHDLVRTYGRERASAEEGDRGRDAATARLFEWYRMAVDEAARRLYPEKLRLPPPEAETDPGRVPARHPPRFGTEPAALAWLDAERPNLVAAVVAAADTGPHRYAWLLADALRGYFWLRMHLVDWKTVAEAGLRAARTAVEPAAEAAAHLSLADLDTFRSRYPDAIAHYERALAFTRATGWLMGQSAALGNLGNVYWRSGRLAEAAEHYTSALDIDQRTGWRAGQAVKRGNLGSVCRALGRLDEAREHYLAALALDVEVGSRNAEGVDLGDLGDVYRAQGRLDEALDHATRGLAVLRAVGDRGSEAETLRILAEIHRDAGRHEAALEAATAALALARDTGERRTETDSLNTLATVHTQLGRPAAALTLHEQALQLARETGTYPEVEACLGLAAAHRRLGTPDRADEHLRRAADLSHRYGYRLLAERARDALDATS
ncbi:AfsR/SARP family transcriptional regulator [Virgisporangium aurantiacum]|uniref:SARP family transcriptional regulator n=1 Tax=Virgisporangium aurantiacum TaxID=175570 RepID=A0A8J3Z4K3_9ACTN|nr:tetratricopeptide repeat protein [Virgisporangium aurantiacum]GIJ57194.1 SARP family transcriptional regulator [Virgisporangium aurantiacum]